MVSLSVAPLAHFSQLRLPRISLSQPIHMQLCPVLPLNAGVRHGVPGPHAASPAASPRSPLCTSHARQPTLCVCPCRCHRALPCPRCLSHKHLIGCRAWLRLSPAGEVLLVPIPTPLPAPEHPGPDALPKLITAPWLLLSWPSTRHRAQIVVVTQQAFLE